MALIASGSPTNYVNATETGQVLYGTSGNDQITTFYGRVARSDSWMYGGLGDDTYVTLSSKDRVFENAGEGIDTVRSDWFYELTANVENITLTGNLSVGATGNDLNNILIGNSAKNFLEGGAGADEMTGGAGNDTFALAGNDVIKDYTTGDLLDVRSFSQYRTFAQVQSVMQQSGTDVILRLTPNDVVTVSNTTVAQLGGSSLLLASDLSNYKLTFSDEFDTLSLNDGTNPDGTWYPLFPRTGLAAHSTVDKGSVQYFTYIGDDGSTGEQVGIDPFSIKDSVLTIEMAPVPASEQYKIFGMDYSSGMINTASSFSQTYGYFEIRTKLPAGQGLHDAFWMLPIDGNWPPEFDVVEGIGKDPNYVINVAHTIDQGIKVAHAKGFSVDSTQFHTYGVDWEPDYITWYIDGVAVRSQPTPPGLDVPMYLLASLGGGGAYAGNPDATTPWPAHMDIDYIRAYASEHTVETGVPANKIGTDGDDALYGTHLNDVLNGGLGNDELYGGGGNDTLAGGGGNDISEGSFGDDTYIISSITEKIIEGVGKGQDTVETALASYTLGGNLENLVYTGSSAFIGTGNPQDNVLAGGIASDTLNGGAGDDKIMGNAGDDTINAGDGNDVTYGGAGVDSIRGNDGDDILYGEDGNDLLKADNGNDLIYGGAGDDNLQGAAGNDMLDGGTGRDRMSGGTGDDTFVVDQSSDTITENSDEGIDTVSTNLARYTLSANVENLIYTGAANFVGTGNALGNLLSGGAGVDTLTGMAGDDTYVVAQASDVVVEQVDGGTDTVRTSLAKFSLGANLENLAYTGTSAFTGTGNALENSIQGGAGADRLNGLAGTDVMAGGAGNDTYVVDNVGDAVIEIAGQGADRVLSKVSYTLSGNVENLTLTSSAKVNGTGNALTNTIVGNGGINVLDGAGGADKLTGGAGSDTFVFRRGEANGDTVTDFSGAGVLGGDILSFVGYGTGAYLTHEAGTDVYVVHAGVEYSGMTETVRLSGVTALGLGDYQIDGLIGLPSGQGGGLPTLPLDHSGNDTYVVGSASDVVTEQPNGGYDTVQTSLSSYTLTDNVERLTYFGSSSFDGTGNALANLIEGGAGADRLSGGAGVDTLQGGGGNDAYVVDNVGDVVIELSSQGTDRVLSRVSYILAGNIENLTLSSSAKINGTGNALANTIVGNDSVNVLDGGSGADTLTGGMGDDIFVFRRGEAGGDTVTDFAGAGVAGGDQLQLIGYGAGATLTQIGTGDIYLIQAGAAHGSTIETLQLTNSAALNVGDFVFA